MTNESNQVSAVAREEQSENQALLPCPFCGTKYPFAMVRRDRWVVTCFKCGAEGPSGDVEDEAGDEWNRRSQASTAPQGQDDAAKLSASQLQTLCAALGWQGGTYWQVVDEVRRLALGKGMPSIYEAIPSSAMDWLTSNDPPIADSQEWRDGWDACKTRVHLLVDAAIAASRTIPAKHGTTNGTSCPECSGSGQLQNACQEMRNCEKCGGTGTIPASGT